jgi:hypothetical protein
MIDINKFGKILDFALKLFIEIYKQFTKKVGSSYYNLEKSFLFSK